MIIIVEFGATLRLVGSVGRSLPSDCLQGISSGTVHQILAVVELLIQTWSAASTSVRGSQIRRCASSTFAILFYVLALIQQA